MAATKTASRPVAGPSRPVAQSTIKRAATSTKPAPAKEDKLAAELERVLRISNPQDGSPQAGKRKTKAMKSLTGASVETVPGPQRNQAPVRQTVAGAKREISGGTVRQASAKTLLRRPATDTVVQPSRAAIRPSSSKALKGREKVLSNEERLPALRVPPATLKGKEKALLIESRYPWAAESSSLRSSERAREAMRDLNASLRSLSDAVQSGYRYAAAKTLRPEDSSRSRGDTTSAVTWTDERVDGLADVCDLALRVLRELDEKALLGDKGIEVERAGQGVVARTIALGMWKRGLEELVTGRRHLLRLYAHQPDVGPDNPSTPPRSTSAKADPPRVVVPRQNTASRRSHPLHSTDAAYRKASASRRPLPSTWLDLTVLPAWTRGASSDDAVKTVLLQALLGAWVCLGALHQDYQLDPSTVSRLPHLPSDGDANPIHPFVLALSLPRTTCASLFHVLHRHAMSTSSPNGLEGLHVQCIALIGLAFTMTADEEESAKSKYSPGYLWSTLVPIISTHVGSRDNESDRATEEASRALGSVVDWVEHMITIRGEENKQWFHGTAWTRLMDQWIAIGRRLNDSSVIERALSYMTASTSIATGPSTPPRNQILPSQTPRRSVKGKHKPSEAEAEVLRLCGDLARTIIALEQFRKTHSDLDAAAADSALRCANLSAIADALLSLEQGETAAGCFAKADRAIERIRLACVKILDGTVKADDSQANSSLISAVEYFLVSGIELVEDVLQSSSLDNSPVAEGLASGAIESLQALSAHRGKLETSTPQSRMTLFEQGQQICVSCSTLVSDTVRAGWLRCLSTNVYNLAGKLWREGKHSEAAYPASASCEWGGEALTMIDKLDSGEEASAWTTLREAMARRWELLALSCQKSDDKPGAIRAFGQALRMQPPVIIQALATGSASRSLAGVFENTSALNATLSRIVFLMISEPELVLSSLADLLPVEGTNMVARFAVEAIGERILGLLEEHQYRPNVAALMFRTGGWLLENYESDVHPLRRSRVIVRMMALISQTGVCVDRFPLLMEEANTIASRTVFGEDHALAPFKQEWTALAFVIQALQAYHATSEPSRAVAELTARAVTALRELVLPAEVSLSKRHALKEVETKLGGVDRALRTRTTAKSATKPARVISARRVARAPVTSTSALVQKLTTSEATSITNLPTFDDPERLSNLLGSLASLLGMLGHVLAKIEVLKLLRAILRNRYELLGDYITRSAQLATEYSKLGKHSRATLVFSEVLGYLDDGVYAVSDAVHIEARLRFSTFLAESGDTNRALTEYASSARLAGDTSATRTKTSTMVAAKTTSIVAQTIDRCTQCELAALARTAAAAIAASEMDATSAILHRSVSFRLWMRSADAICRLSPDLVVAESTANPSTECDDPFRPPDATKPAMTGQNEPAKDDTKPVPSQVSSFEGRHLHGLQWHVAEEVLKSLFDLVIDFAARGSVRDSEYFLKLAGKTAAIVKSSIMSARVAAKTAQLQYRLRRFDESAIKLEEASETLQSTQGPDAVDVKRIQGDLFSRQDQVDEAGTVFATISEEIQDLDVAFAATEALIISPKKIVNGSIRKSSKSATEPLLPVALAHVLREQAWILHEAGSAAECKRLLGQVGALTWSSESKAEEHYLAGRIGLHDAFVQFKTDLFMSSLTESTIAMPMGISDMRGRDRQSTRKRIEVVLERADMAYRSALTLVASNGRIEDVRRACLSLALLRAFQTSLGQGGPDVTTTAASLLANSPAITLRRELLEAIDCKFEESNHDDIKWRILAGTLLGDADQPAADDPDSDGEKPLRRYWQSLRQKYASNDFLSSDASDVSSLPHDWAVVSINVTEDRNTMFISRHQNGHEPLIFCLPLDRQGRREGEDDAFTFDMAVEEFEDIISTSNNVAQSAKGIEAREAKLAWWAERRALDERLKQLLAQLEFCWLGAFKTILSPRPPLSASQLEAFRNKLQKVFLGALSEAGGDSKRAAGVQLDEALLVCFATLSSKCKDEEAEDLVYFILDVYQFHGVPVALAELDIDQICIDVKSVLLELENTVAAPPSCAPEHLFLALDKNVAGFPWESIPMLRGRAISRIPSLSFLLDQVALGAQISPSTAEETNPRRQVNTQKTFYILNPSGDLSRTQTHFEPWISQMVEKAGWKGIVGRPPTELEMVHALREYDLVLYFGHGGAEQYIRSFKIRHLPKCASTMLWGCSSGRLKEQGDFDRTGTAWNYMIAGCPSLVANLWDVTDRDIDCLSEEVFKNLHLDASHVPDRTTSQSKSSRMPNMLPLTSMSTIEAVNASRDACRLTYLTGAAPVVYGIPVYLH